MILLIHLLATPVPRSLDKQHLTVSALGGFSGVASFISTDEQLRVFPLISLVFLTALKSKTNSHQISHNVNIVFFTNPFNSYSNHKIVATAVRKKLYNDYYVN